MVKDAAFRGRQNLRWGRQNPPLGEFKPFVGGDPAPRTGNRPPPYGESPPSVAQRAKDRCRRMRRDVQSIQLSKSETPKGLGRVPDLVPLTPGTACPLTNSRQNGCFAKSGRTGKSLKARIHAAEKFFEFFNPPFEKLPRYSGSLTRVRARERRFRQETPSAFFSLPFFSIGGLGGMSLFPFPFLCPRSQEAVHNLRAVHNFKGGPDRDHPSFLLLRGFLLVCFFLTSPRHPPQGKRNG